MVGPSARAAILGPSLAYVRPIFKECGMPATESLRLTTLAKTGG